MKPTVSNNGNVIITIVIFFCGQVWFIRANFRKHVSEVRPDTVHVTAFTVTANPAIRKFIILLSHIVYVPPIKNIITYLVGDNPNSKAASALQPICSQALLLKQLGLIIIFYKSYSAVINLHQYFK